MSKSELHDFKGYLVKETDGAYLVRVDDERDIWFPKYCTENNNDGTFTTSLEMAEEKEIA